MARRVCAGITAADPAALSAECEPRARLQTARDETSARAASILDALARHRGAATEVAAVNGRAAVVLRRDGRVVAVLSFELGRRRIRRIWLIDDPEKLDSWNRSQSAHPPGLS